jgi:hypothetical protein
MDAAMGGVNDKPWESKPSQQSFDTWWKSAVDQFSSKDNAEEEFKKALEQSGVTEEQVKGQYESKQAQKSSEFSWRRDTDILKYVEESFPDWQSRILAELQGFRSDMNHQWESWRDKDWQAGWIKSAWKKDWIDTAWYKVWIDEAWRKEWINTQWSLNWLGLGAEKGDSTFGWNWKSFMDTVIDRFITYTTYTSETKAAYAAINEIRSKNKKLETGDAVLALAKALTSNNEDMLKGLQDPQVQTNALLSQILIVLEAIMQAENTSGGATLATTLSALGLGLTSNNINTKSKT